METAYIRSRILSSLLLGALGDALGYTVEFSPWSSIRAGYGPNGILDPVPAGKKAIISDDTQMTLFTAEGYILGYQRANLSGVGANIEHCIYQAYLCWLKTQGYSVDSLWMPVSSLVDIPELNIRRAPGNTCLSALNSGAMGTIERPINNSKGCGGVMRTAPLGFVRSSSGRNPFGSPLLNGARAAAITHGHPMGYIPAGMLSDIVDRCIYGDYFSLEAVVSASLEATKAQFAGYEGMEEFEGMIRRAVELSHVPVAENEGAEVDEAAVRSLGGGWVGDEALAIAVYCALRHQNDAKAALRAAVNHSGDSDSTGAIAGNILGAWLGMDAVPQDWVEKLELVDTIEEIADALVRIAETA